MNAGLEGTPLTCLSFARREGEVLIAGTRAAACWLWTLNTGIAADPERGTAATGLRAWPNPCRGRLNLSLGTAGPSRLRVYDASGRVVVRSWLTDRHATLDLRGLPAGVYHLETDNGHARTHAAVTLTGK